MYLFAITNVFDFCEIGSNVNSISAITHLPGLHNKNIFGTFFLPLIFGGLLPLLNLLQLFAVKVKELLKLRVTFPFLNVESDRDVLKRIDGKTFTIVFDVIEYGFFIGKMVVSVNMVVRFFILACYFS